MMHKGPVEPSVLAIRSLILAVAIAGCTGAPPPECTEFEQVFVYTDADGDGYGIDDPIGYVCTPGPNQSTNTVDCDDDNSDVHPGAEEVCDDIDNDCNGVADETQPKLPYYRDADGDGFGSKLSADKVLACSPPDGYISTGGDCKDNNPDINPAAHEICNGGVDDDCDGQADDNDGSVDLTSRTRYYVDKDGDGYGSETRFLDLCVQPSGSVKAGGDCNDNDSSINPKKKEICDGADNDCNGLADDDDPGISVNSQTATYDDFDGDGFGDPSTLVNTCRPRPPSVLDGTDCDDSDASVHTLQDWNKDLDGDGFGGTVQVTQCADPGGGLLPASGGVDCDDKDSSIHPGAAEVCADGIDQDCSGVDQCHTCKEWLDNAPGLPDGVYAIDPVTDDRTIDVWCDMTTDGGGWTLVGSTLGIPFDDAGTTLPNYDLETLSPANAHTTIWSGLSGRAPNAGDIRFACKDDVADTDMTVDLSFYDIGWYSTITTGADWQSCFSYGAGAGADSPPARQNNLTGDFLDAGDQWSAGFLEGERTCSDQGSFTVDFDDRGMGGDPNDGTDWGEAAYLAKCGTSGSAVITSSTAWYVFYREP